MKPKKIPKTTKKDKAWQEEVEKQLKVEKVVLGHPQGKRRFEEVVKRVLKSKPNK